MFRILTNLFPFGLLAVFLFLNSISDIVKANVLEIVPERDVFFIQIPLKKFIQEKTGSLYQIDIPVPGLPAEGMLTEKNRYVAAILALTLGIVGAHRIYLGTKPIVPVVYIITLGGGVGILPVIDFFVLLTSKDITPYENNPKVFMWME
ncbi:MAG: TM2 domain-containing protein [Bacteroidetes bacterium]|nr:TM2 domain-containing protein [Bacteroidota bacterium]